MLYRRCGETRCHAAIITATILLATALTGHAQQRELARQILDATGVRGGLIVHVGCGDGKLTAALRAGEGYVVQGLESDSRQLAAARENIRSAGAYGPVSAIAWNGRNLPYADKLCNLVVVEDRQQLSGEELQRVLAPLGVAYVKQGGQWTKTVKPWPADIDQWTHHLHDSGGNAVAHDRVAGPPQHLQWTAGPLWSRSHGWSPSVSAMVSANGRVFTICDETLTCVDGTVPDKWFLSARDAFSGVLLWKCPVPQWGSQALSGTPGAGGGSTTGRFTMPPNLGKRLVAVGDTVYVTLGATAPVTALDAATGCQRQVYSETARADEILSTGDRLIVTINPSEQPPVAADRKSPPEPAQGKRVCAVDVPSGKILWNRGPFAAIRATRTQDPFGRLELAADPQRVVILTHEAIEALAADSGKTLWRIDRPALPEKADRRLGFAGMYEFLLTTMVYHDGVVLLAQPEPNSPHSYHTMPGTLYAFDAASGRQMWKRAYGAWGHCTQPDVFVVNGVVWTHVHTDGKFNISENGWLHVPNTANFDYRIQGLDLQTGQLRQEWPTRDILSVGHHHRCYRNKITDQYLMCSRRGVEFVDLATGENYQNHWVRSGCLLGNLPCNGMIYVAPHDCGCYIEAKLTGFNVLAPERGQGTGDRGQGNEPLRLEKGRAYSAVSNPQSRIPNPSDWPSYRHDPGRSGATESPVATKLAIAWKSPVGCRPSGLTIADGKVFAAAVDAHTVYALDARTGKRLWSYTAGARVDSPPAISGGLAIFGSADGHVYALRAADGALAWRFRAAPEESAVIAFDQLESPWPVPGSVLVHEGKCWFAAGRSSYLDGGIHAYALDPVTGEIAQERTIYSPDPKTGKMPLESSANLVAGVLNDIPAAAGQSVFLRQMNVAAEERGGPHLFTTGGYLDPTWFNRTFWRMGRAQTSGIMVLGHDCAYGMEVFDSTSRETVFTPGANALLKPGASAYRLLCLALADDAGPPAAKQPKKAKAGKARAIWQQRVPIRVTAMVRAGEVVFVAGSPDIVDPADPHAAWEGRRGGVLAAFAAADGKPLAELTLDSPPVWDGMAAAEGSLYLSTLDGNVLRLAAK